MKKQEKENIGQPKSDLFKSEQMEEEEAEARMKELLEARKCSDTGAKKEYTGENKQQENGNEIDES